MNNYQFNILKHQQTFTLPLARELDVSKELLSQDSYQISFYDKIFLYLRDQGIIDENHNVTAQFEKLAPHLQNLPMQRLKTLLTDEFQVKSETSTLEFSTTLTEIFIYLNIKSFEIIGGTVFQILGPEYMREVITRLKIPSDLIPKNFFDQFKKKAADIDIRVPISDDPENYKRSIIEFFKMKLPKFSISDIKNFAFTKFYTHKSNTDHFGIVSFGNRNNFLVDLLFIKNLKRKNLFCHDALKITISGFAVHSFSVRVDSNSDSIAKPLICRLTKTLEAENHKEIDYSGSAMLFKYLTTGWRYRSKELEESLLSTISSGKDFTIFTKTLKNHFPNESIAPFIFCFHLYYLMPEYLTSKLSFFSKTVIENSIESADPFFKLFKEITEHLILSETTAQNDFKLMLAYFQIFGTIACRLKNSKSPIIVRKLQLKNETHLQFEFKTPNPLYFTLKDDLESALALFRQPQTIKTPLSTFFERLNVFLFGPDFETVSSDNPNIKKASCDFLECDDFVINKTGFYLLCAEAKSQDLPFLLAEFIKLIEKERNTSVKQNLFRALLTNLDRYALDSSDIKAFELLLQNENSSFSEIQKNLSLMFIYSQNPAINQFVYQIWTNQPGIFDGLSHLKLAKQFASQYPHTSLKILSTLDSLQPELQKQLFDTICIGYLKNTLLLERDLLALGQVAIALILKMPLLKRPLKKDEFSNFEVVAEKLITVDFLRGFEIFQNLKSKNMTLQDIDLVLSASFAKEKATRIIAINRNIPLTYKDSGLVLERLKLLLEAVSADLGLNEMLHEEIFKILNNIINSGTPLSDKIKILLKTKFEWFLLTILEKSRKAEDGLSLIALYFEIGKAVDIQIFLRPALLNLLFITFNELLLKSKDSFILIKNYLDSFIKRNPKQLMPDEMNLYQHLAEVAMIGLHPEISRDFIQRILTHLHFNKKSVDTDTLNLLDLCLLNLKNSQALSLLEFFDSKFPQTLLLNHDLIWKKIILGLENQEQVITVILNKSLYFAKDEEVLKKVGEVVFFLLKDTLRVPLALKLMQAYRLTNESTLESLKKQLARSTDKKLPELACTALQRMEVSLVKQLPFLEILADFESEIFTLFFETYGQLVSAFEDAHLKRDFLYILTLGFLNQKAACRLKVQITVWFLEEELKKHAVLSPEKQNKINLKFVETFVESKDWNVSLLVLRKLNELLRNSNSDQINDLLLLFARTLRNLPADKDSSINEQIDISYNILRLKVDLSNMIPFLENLRKDDGKDLVFIGCSLAETVIKTLPGTIPENVLVPFKSTIKKFINLFLVSKYKLLVQMLLVKRIFSDQEILIFQSKFARVMLSDKKTIQSVKDIKEALLYCLPALHSPEIPLDKELLQLVVRHLAAIICMHDDEETYRDIIKKIITPLFVCLKNCPGFSQFSSRYSDPRNYFNYLHCETSEKTVFDAHGEKLMKEKFFHFFNYFIVDINNSLNKLDKFSVSVLNLLLSNIVHFNVLFKFFPEHPEKIICLLLDFFPNITYTSFDLIKSTYEAMSSVLTLIIQNNSFIHLTKSDEKMVFKFFVLLGRTNESKFLINVKEQINITVGVINSLLELKYDGSLMLALHLLNLNKFFIDPKRFKELNAKLIGLFNENNPELENDPNGLKNLYEKFRNGTN